MFTGADWGDPRVVYDHAQRQQVTDEDSAS